MPNDMIRSPFSYRRCVWYHCAIDEEKCSGKEPASQTRTPNEYSGHLFDMVVCKKLTAYSGITVDSLFFSTQVTIVSIRASFNV